MIVPLYRAQCLYRGRDDDPEFNLEFITDRLSEVLQKVKASDKDWEGFLNDWAIPVWGDESFSVEAIIKFKNFKDVILQVRVLKMLFSNMEEDIKFQLVQALKNEYVLWSNAYSDETTSILSDRFLIHPANE